MRAAVLTISTTIARGEGEDLSGPALVELCRQAGLEAVHEVVSDDREAPGYAETIRAESRKHTPLGILTRGVSGIRGRTLVINFPGSPKAIGQSWPVVEPTLKHAAATLERA